MTHPVDLLVGKRLRLCRLLTGITQETLAAELGITYQQLQKYEKGGNRISASRLYDLARALKVPVSYFFDDTPLGGVEHIGERETLELVRAYSAISNPRQRRAIYDLVRTFTERIKS